MARNGDLDQQRRALPHSASPDTPQRSGCQSTHIRCVQPHSFGSLSHCSRRNTRTRARRERGYQRFGKAQSKHGRVRHVGLCSAVSQKAYYRTGNRRYQDGDAQALRPSLDVAGDIKQYQTKRPEQERGHIQCCIEILFRYHSSPRTGCRSLGISLRTSSAFSGFSIKPQASVFHASREYSGYAVR